MYFMSPTSSTYYSFTLFSIILKSMYVSMLLMSIPVATSNPRLCDDPRTSQFSIYCIMYVLINKQASARPHILCCYWHMLYLTRTRAHGQLFLSVWLCDTSSLERSIYKETYLPLSLTTHFSFCAFKGCHLHYHINYTNAQVH